MALSNEALALIAKLEVVHERASGGDQEAVNFIKSLKTRALGGDEQARRVYNTLAAIHWKKQKGGDYDKAEAYYMRLRAKEPKAMAKLQVLLDRVRQHDPEAKTLFSVLKSIHGKFKSSAFSDGPGAPKIGHYPLPSHHAPGIIIGAEAPRHGHGGGNPMHIPYAHQTQRIAGIQVPNPRFSGTGRGLFSVGAAPAEPLTAAALATLLALIARVRQLSPTASVINLASSVTAQSLSAPGGFAPGMTMVALPQGATSAQMEAFKNSATTAAQRAALGQVVVNNNPVMSSLINQNPNSRNPDWLTGFYTGVMVTMNRQADGPGQQAMRDAMTAGTSGTQFATRRDGYLTAQLQQYDLSKRMVPITLPRMVSAMSTGPRPTAAQDAAALANQGICNLAADALAHGYESYPSLARQCAATRRTNIMSGQYFADASSPDNPAYRVALTDAGTAVVAKNPALQQVAATLTGAKQRGFIMAMGVRAGQMDPNFPAFVRPGLSSDPNLIAGFDLGMSMQ